MIDLKIGQRYKYHGFDKRFFICELISVDQLEKCRASVKVIQDGDWGARIGYVYRSENLNQGGWEYLPGQDVPSS